VLKGKYSFIVSKADSRLIPYLALNLEAVPNQVGAITIANYPEVNDSRLTTLC